MQSLRFCVLIFSAQPYIVPAGGEEPPKSTCQDRLEGEDRRNRLSSKLLGAALFPTLLGVIALLSVADFRLSGIAFADEGGEETHDPVLRATTTSGRTAPSCQTTNPMTRTTP